MLNVTLLTSVAKSALVGAVATKLVDTLISSKINNKIEMRRGTFSGVLFIKNRIRNEAFMKNWKRYGALLGVVLLLLVYMVRIF